VARRSTPSPPVQSAQLTSEQMRAGIGRLRKLIDEIKLFDPRSVTEQYNIPEMQRLQAAVQDRLARTFGADSLEYERYKAAAIFDNGPHNYAYEVPIQEVQQSLERSKGRSIALVEQAVQSLEEQIAETGEPAARAVSKPSATAPYTPEAARAVLAAIERLRTADTRPYVHTVPLEAERLLLREHAGRLSTSDASRQIKEAIFGLNQEGKIAAFPEPQRDWVIREPLEQEKIMTTAHPSKVFIVHGRDDGTKQTVARFVEKLGFEAIILHERPNKGRTIISKFREESEGVGFAVVLMTPDDVGKARDASDLNPRARQNVVFELGFFIGTLKLERVAAMVKGSIERPSDFDGVVYISLDQADWPTQLAKELKAAGYEFDAGKALL
jgi:predicted nucleotide-binding protein